MRQKKRFAALIAAFGIAQILSMPAAQAAGALAVGKCGAYGYAFDFARQVDAERLAQKRCKGDCKIVPMRRACGALAIDMLRPCGAFGFAVEKRISAAQNAALRQCHQYGGKECVIRAWACDAKG